MAYSYNDYGAKSPGDTIVVGFPFREREHVSIQVDGSLVSPTKWGWLNDGLIECLSGFPSGTTTRVQRNTPDDELEGRLVGTATLDYPVINANSDRLLYVLQERADAEEGREARMGALEEDLANQQGSLDASAELARRWAEETTDVPVLTGQFSAKHHAEKAQGSADLASSRSQAADSSAEAAADSEGAAAASSSAAMGYRDTAQKWATEAEDVAVTPGLYSAFHWAMKAMNVVWGGLSATVHALASKAAPVAADEVFLVDSAASWAAKKTTLNLAVVAGLPQRIAASADYAANWDTIRGAGWYYGNSTSLNGPYDPTGIVSVGFVEVPRSDTAVQTVYSASTGTSADTMCYRRVFKSGAWGAWYKLQISQAEQDARYLKLAGGTLTGALTLNGAPSSNLHAATKQYVDTNYLNALGQCLGVGQAWQDMEGSRVGGTDYQNTSGRPIAVSIIATSNTATGTQVQVSANGSSWLRIGQCPPNTSLVASNLFIVPNGYYYRVVAALASGYTWKELR